MKNKVITLIMLLGMLSLVSTYYAGETIVVENQMGIENLVYAIIGNSSPVNLIIEVDINNISITFPQDMAPDSFDIVFLEEQIVVQTITVNSGGGSGGSTKYVYRNVTEYITEYVEVDNYIDREVIVDGETIEDIKENKFTLKPVWIIPIFIVAITIIILLTRWIIRTFKEDDEE